MLLPNGCEGERCTFRSAFTRCVLVFLLLHGAAKPSTLSEYEIKAAYLLNFARFTEWSEADLPPQAPVSICVIGEDPFGPILTRVVEGESINGHKIVIQRIKRPEEQTCHVAFFSRNYREVSKGLSSLPRHVLTVGEAETFIRDGGMIAFVVDHRRIRFDVSTSATRSSGLRISSRLLAVARTVER